MLKNILRGLISRFLALAFLLGVFLLIGYCRTDRKDYPGKREFNEANSLIGTNSKGPAHGNTDNAKKVAAKFSSGIKLLQRAFFKSRGISAAAGGEFVTYCRHDPQSVAFIVHVPGLRGYKDATARDTLATLAWTAAEDAAKELSFSTNSPDIIVGLRGVASYGPIWSGKLGSAAETKTDDIEEVRRLYPFFAHDSESHTVIPESTAR